MPNGIDDGLTRIPIIGPIIGVLGGLFGGSSGGGTRGPRTRRVLPTFPHPPVPSQPPAPTDSFATPGGVIDVSGQTPAPTSPPSTSTPTPTGETDRDRRRRERREARERANRRTNVSILSAFQTGLGIINQLSGLRRSSSTPASSLALPAPTSSLPMITLPGLGALGTAVRRVDPSTMNFPARFRTGGRIDDSMMLNRPPSGFHFAKDGSGKIVRNRTMNVLNLHAAKRAIRRIKGARKVLRSIESSLPKRAASSSTRKRR